MRECDMRECDMRECDMRECVMTGCQPVLDTWARRVWIAATSPPLAAASAPRANTLFNNNHK